MRASVSFVFVSALLALTQAKPTGVQAAQVDPSALLAMSADAQSKGFTPVVVHLADVSLSEMADIEAVKTKMAARAALLTAELGQEAITAGRWENGIGQLGLNATPAGLKLLQNSSNALSFSPGQPWYARTTLSGEDGRLLALERQLVSHGHADVQVVLNVDGLEFDVAKTGAIVYRSNDKAVASMVLLARRLLEPFTGAQALGKEAVMDRFASMLGQSSLLPIRPEFGLRVNREGLERLAASPEVRDLKPVGFRDRRPVSFDAQALSLAEKNGQAEVVITVRTPLAGGPLSAASRAANTQSNKRTLEAVLRAAGVRRLLQDLSAVGAMAGPLNAAELRALRAQADPRLLSVTLNKPVATAAAAAAASVWP